MRKNRCPAEARGLVCDLGNHDGVLHFDENNGVAGLWWVPDFELATRTRRTGLAWSGITGSRLVLKDNRNLEEGNGA